MFGSLGHGRLLPRDHRLPADSPYSASKAASDHFVRAWHHTYGLPTLITNCSNNYGPYHFPEKLIPLMILNALEGKPLPVYGKGENVRDWLYVEDHAAALILVLPKRASRARPTISAAQRAHQHRGRRGDLRARRRDGAGRPDRPARNADHLRGRPPGHDLRYAIDASKIERELGWRPAETFETGLRKTVPLVSRQPGKKKEREKKKKKK